MNQNPFAGMNDANPAGGGGTYIKSAGRFVVEIDVMKLVPARGGGSIYVFAEFKILESDNPDHPVGSERCWCVDLAGDYPKMGQGDLRLFMAAVMQQEEGTFDFEKEAPEVMGPTQPFKGFTVALKVTKTEMKNGPTKNNPDGLFPKHKWSEHTS